MAQQSTLAVRMLAEPVRTTAFGSISGTYIGVGTVLANPCRIMFVQNLTDATLMFSLDGVNDHFPLPANGFLVLDISSNQSLAQGFFMSQGQRLYVKEIGVPTTGSVYFSSFYGAAL